MCSYCRGISVEIHLVIIYFLYNLEHLYLNNDTKYSEDFMAAAIQQRQRDELHRRIWQIANDVRGAIDGWDFKQYVLGALFYRFISDRYRKPRFDNRVRSKHKGWLAPSEEVKSKSISLPSGASVVSCPSARWS